MAIGDADLTGEAGGLLLAAIAAEYGQQADDAVLDEFTHLARLAAENPEAVGRTRLRHRHQDDHEGLKGGVHKLTWQPDGTGAGWRYTPSNSAKSADYRAQLFAVIKALNLLDARDRLGRADDVIRAARSAGNGQRALEEAGAGSRTWARELLGAQPGDSADVIRRKFREKVITIHPDAGGTGTEAGALLGELLAARKLLEVDEIPLSR
jgi:hypothetical protein